MSQRQVRLIAYVRNDNGTESIAEIVEPYLSKGGARRNGYRMVRQSVRRWKRIIANVNPNLLRIVRENLDEKVRRP